MAVKSQFLLDLRNLIITIHLKRNAVIVKKYCDTRNLFSIRVWKNMLYKGIKMIINIRIDASDRTCVSLGNPKVRCAKFHNQVAWARQYLVWEGLLDSSKYGIWALTKKGRQTSMTENQAHEIFLKWVDVYQKARKN